jgi:hypothetical protein
MIVSPLNQTLGMAKLWVLSMVFTVNFPVNGLKHLLSPQIIAFVIWQILLFYILLVRFSRLKNRKEQNTNCGYCLFYFHILLFKGFEP